MARPLASPCFPTAASEQRPRLSVRSNPVFHPQPPDALELAGVVRHQRGALGECVTRDPQIVRPDGRAGVLQARELLRVVLADGRACRKQHRQLSDRGFPSAKDLRLRRAALGALQQLNQGHEGHAQPGIRRQRIDPLRIGGRLVLDQVDEDVGVQHVDQSTSHSCRGC